MKLHKSFQVALLLYLLVLANLSCKKYYFFNNDTLPAETQIGAQTIGCMIDNKVWIPKSNNLTPARHLSFLNQQLYISANKANEYIHIDVINIVAEGKYNLSTANTNTEYIISNADYKIIPTTYKCISGSLEVTKIDRTKSFISGRFSFVAEEQNTKKIVNITDGRFDLEFK